MAIWELATNLSKTKQGPVVFLSLKGKAQEAVLELGPTVIGAEDGLAKLYEKLDSLFKIDTAQASLSAYADFEKYMRPSSMSMADFNIEFDRMVGKLKEYEIKLPEAVLAHRVLKSANLSEDNEKLVVATVNDATYKDMMDQIKKIMRVHPDVKARSEVKPISCVKTESSDVSVCESNSSANANDQEEEFTTVSFKDVAKTGVAVEDIEDDLGVEVVVVSSLPRVKILLVQMANLLHAKFADLLLSIFGLWCGL